MRRNLSRIGSWTLLLALAFGLSGLALADEVITDDFSDGDYTKSPAWVVDSGSFSVKDGELSFGTEPNTTIHLDIGDVTWKTPVEVSFKLRQGDATAAAYLFAISLSDAAANTGYGISASPHPGYFGTSGFYDGSAVGKPGAKLNQSTSPQVITVRFDPAANSLTLKQDGKIVWEASNRMNLSRVNRLTLAAGGTISWFVDDVRVEATLRDPSEVLPPGTNAIQTVYRSGVPHTDKRGRRMMQYDPERSFFQIGTWGNPFGNIYGTYYDLKVLVDSGYNTMWPWPRPLEAELQAGEEAGLQVVHMHAISEELLEKFKDHPNLLGNVWMDEPTGGLWGKDMEGGYKNFLAYKEKANSIAPDMCVFINDVPWITPPATEWWTKWNTAGDVSCHDNYPIMHAAQTQSIKSIALTVGLAASVNDEKAPVWLVVGAFDTDGKRGFTFRYPTPMQLRACVYGGLIHGATGIIYFTWDTYVCRDGGVTGMSPEPKFAYSPFPRKEGYTSPTPATPVKMVQSKALWVTATQINKEIAELTPCLLSPTVGEDELEYSVAVTELSRNEYPVHCLLKPHPDGGYVLLTVNLDDNVLTSTFAFSKVLKSVEKLFENQLPLTIKEGARSFEDWYRPFEVHAYRILLAE